MKSSRQGLSNPTATRPTFPTGREAGIYSDLQKDDHQFLLTELRKIALWALKFLHGRARMKTPEAYIQDAIADLWSETIETFREHPRRTRPALEEIARSLIRLLKNSIQRDARLGTVTLTVSSDDGKLSRERVVRIETSVEEIDRHNSSRSREDILIERSEFAALVVEACEQHLRPACPPATVERVLAVLSGKELEQELVTTEFREDNRSEKSGQMRLDAEQLADMAKVSNRTAFRDQDAIREAQKILPPYAEFVRKRKL